jgi:hypothetical protein
MVRDVSAFVASEDFVASRDPRGYVFVVDASSHQRRDTNVIDFVEFAYQDEALGFSQVARENLVSRVKTIRGGDYLQDMLQHTMQR